MDSTLCSTALKLSQNLAVHISHVQQILGGLLGIITLSYFVYNKQRMPKLLGGSTKVLLWWMIAFVLIHNAFVSAVNILQEVLYLTYSHECDFLFRTWQCLIFRIPTISSIIGISSVYVILLLDRLSYIFLPNHYSSAKAPYAISLALIVFISAVTTFIFYGEDLSSFKHHCVASSSNNSNRLTVLYEILFVSHIICTIGFFLILRRSFFLLKWNKHNFVVNEKLKLRMDVASMRFMVTNTICSFVLIDSFLCASFLFRRILPTDNFIERSAWIDSSYIIQWYGVVLFMLLYNWNSFSIQHSKVINLREEKQIHFQQISSLWNKY